MQDKRLIPGTKLYKLSYFNSPFTKSVREMDTFTIKKVNKVSVNLVYYEWKIQIKEIGDRYFFSKKDAINNAIQLHEKDLIQLTDDDDIKINIKEIKSLNTTLKKIQYYRTPNGWLVSVYSGMKRRTKLRNYPPLTFTKEELYNFVFIKNKNKFDKLWNDWEKSKYKTSLRPSINRINDYLGYTLNNIELITWEENDKLGRKCLKTIKGHVVGGIKNGKPVLQFSLDGKFIKKYYSTGEASRQTKILQSTIVNVCINKGKTAGSFVWRYFENVGNVKKINTKPLNLDKSILQFTLNGKFLNKYNSFIEAELQTNICATNINWACQNKSSPNKQKIAGGFIWKYHKDVGDIKKLDMKKICLSNFQPVIQLSLNNKFIKEYISISEAYRQTGASSISLVCQKKQKTSGKFKWEYKNKEVN